LRNAPDQKVLVDTTADAVPLLAKYLVEHNIGISSLRSMNSLEAYFLSLTSGNEVE